MQFVRNEHHGLFHVWELGVSLLGRIMAANSSATKIIRAGLGPPDLNCISQTFALQLRAAAIACALRIASDLIHTYCELETNETLVRQRGTTA